MDDVEKVPTAPPRKPRRRRNFGWIKWILAALIACVLWFALPRPGTPGPVGPNTAPTLTPRPTDTSHPTTVPAVAVPTARGTSASKPEERLVTWMELVAFLEQDHTNWNEYSESYVCFDFAVDLVANAHAQGIKAWVVTVFFVGEEIGHAFAGFETSDRGIVFVEPQADIPYAAPRVGEPLCDAWGWAECTQPIESIDYQQCDHSGRCTPYEP